MGNFTDMLKGLAGVAAKLAPQIIPGAGPLISAGKAIADAIGSLNEAHTGPPVPEADAAAADLMAKVNAHAQSTFGRAEGG